MVRRFQENTLHTGRIAYLKARGLTELDYPVLVRPSDERYSYVVAQYPVVDEAKLYWRVWEPSDSMHLLATDLFGSWYTGYRQPISDDRIIWQAARQIHRFASFAYPEVREKGRKLMKRVAQHLTEQHREFIPPTSLAVAAEFYRWMGGLVFPHHMTASFGAATLLLMIGVPRERVAVFGMYYQDPTVYYQANSDWRAGFMAGTPYMTTLGLYVADRWIPIDFTLLASSPREQMPTHPAPHLRPARLGQNPADGAELVIDYAHPYTMIFASTPPDGEDSSPLLARIPLLLVD